MLKATAGDTQGSVHSDVTICVQGRCNDDPKSRTVSIVVTDSCPECETDHLDLQVSLPARSRAFCVNPR